jgi:hypothetical protein
MNFCAYGKGCEYSKGIYQFLKASVADTEMVQSQVNGKKEYFVRIGTFRTAHTFTALISLPQG